MIPTTKTNPKERIVKEKKATIVAHSIVPIRKIARKTAGYKKLMTRVIDLRLSPVLALKKYEYKVIPSPYTASVPRLLMKLVAIILVVSINSIGLFNIGATLGYYGDKESSDENIFQAGSVDFIATTTPQQDPLAISLNMEPWTTTSRSYSVHPLASNPFQYFASTTITDGDRDFCEGIQATFKQGTGTLFTGSFSNLITATTTTFEDFSLDATTGAGNFQNKFCNFDIDFNGWQTRHNLPSLTGYSDRESATSTLASWGFRINKVYYDVDSVHGSETGNGSNEWVEIYNQTDTALDLSDWKICDNNSCDRIPSSPLVPAKGFAIITASSTTWSYWNIPNDVVKIVLNSQIGNGLSNDEDMLLLKRPDGVIIDQMNWGTPISTWAHYNANVWNPGAIDAPEGHALGRKPNGYDTNLPSDFVDFGMPTVSMVNPIGGEVWYVGNSYEVQWTAHNLNGDDSDLKISLWYSNNSGVTWAKFASNLNNTGTYHWVVPLFIGTYYVPSHISRIKAVAVGPENFMIQATGSSQDFCPPINYDALSPEDQQLVDELVANGIIDVKEVIKGGIHAEEPPLTISSGLDEDISSVPSVVDEQASTSASTSDIISTEGAITEEMAAEEDVATEEVIDIPPATVSEPETEPVIESDPALEQKQEPSTEPESVPVIENEEQKITE